MCRGGPGGGKSSSPGDLQHRGDGAKRFLFSAPPAARRAIHILCVSVCVSVIPVMAAPITLSGDKKQRISVVLHTAIAEQIVNELASGEGGRVHGAKCLAVLAGVA